MEVALQKLDDFIIAFKFTILRDAITNLAQVKLYSKLFYKLTKNNYKKFFLYLT